MKSHTNLNLKYNLTVKEKQRGKRIIISSLGLYLRRGFSRITIRRISQGHFHDASWKYVFDLKILVGYNPAGSTPQESADLLFLT